MHRECFEAIKSLRLNSDIMITKPDKGSGVVILNKTDYLTKMNSILNDSSKFQNIGPLMIMTTLPKWKENFKNGY